MRRAARFRTHTASPSLSNKTERVVAHTCVECCAKQRARPSPLARRHRVANFPSSLAVAAPSPSANPSLPLGARFVMQLYSS
ncbi:jg26435 [Pararge aegeria aegeria]|uniref:Jg26435 protein n=1 Tax=Pararge aegeria aegeria TaxID=348720 RepID=A0A8S4QXF9_9NEOP|nr:jg26435 [Pararge aegeria aegeria]